MSDNLNNLIEKIKAEFAEKYAQSKQIQSLLKGKSLEQADEYTKQIGAILGEILGENIRINSAEFADAEFLQELLNQTMGENHRLINQVASNIQKQIDKKQQINLNPQQADFPTERITNLAAYTAARDLTQEPAQRDFVGAVENINNSIFDNYVEKNADFRSRAGFRVTLNRYGAGCCSWCAALVGRYVYPDVPADIWARHKFCNCTIDYTNSKTGSRDRVRFVDKKVGDKIITKKVTTRITPEQAKSREKEILTRKQVTRLTPQQAKAREQEILTRKPLTFGGKSGIIKTNNNFHDSSDVKLISITNEAINSVPKFNEFETPELNQSVQNTCREILQNMKEAEIGTEQLAVININTLEKQFSTGESGGGLVKAIKFNEPYLSIHNHPSCQTFSTADIKKLYDDVNCKSVIVVGNNGNNIFIMKKEEDFNSMGFFEYVMKKELGFSSYNSDYEFMKGAEKYGIKYYERTN